MEVGPFNKAWDECNSFEDKFLYYFKNLPIFASKPDTQQDSYFEDLLAAAEYSNMTKAEREAYNRRLKIMRDNQNADDFAREKAIKEGLEKGLEQGLAQGLEQGRAEANRLNALKMLQEGIPADVIQRVTGLTENEILEIK